MTRQPWVGLVCAGPVSRTGLARLPKLHDQLGWVKSTNIATASRAVNSLRCGRAVRDYESLSKAELILIQAPEGAAPSLVDELAASGLHWNGKSVALVHPTLDASVLAPLERLGATPASMSVLGGQPIRFLVEGHSEALKRIRRLLKAAQAAPVQIDRGRKAEYLGGVYALTADFLPLVGSAVTRFRRAGMAKGEAIATAASLVDSSMKAYFRAGNRLLARPRRKMPE